MQALERVDENKQAEKKQKGKKKREGPSLMYEDDNAVQHDFSMI